MAYIIKQKLKISDLVSLSLDRKRILLQEQDRYLAALYQHYLSLHNFDVKHCPALNKLGELSDEFHPQLLLFGLNEQNYPYEIAELLSFRNHYPEAFIITVGFDTNTEYLRRLLGLGVSSHLNRRHSRPQDIVVVTKSLFIQ